MKSDIINACCYVFLGMFIICALAMTFGSGDKEYEEYREAKRKFFEQQNRRESGRDRDDRDHDRRASILGFGGDR